MDGIGGDAGGGGGTSPSDAVMIMPTPDNSMVQDPPESRPKPLSNDQELSQQDNPPIPFHTPISLENTQLSQPQSPPRQNMLPPLPPLSLPSSVPPNTLAPSWSQTRSPTSTPSNPFYTSTYRSSTPPMPSSSEQSPIISPAKRFSSGEVKPVFTPNSPRQPLNEEDRIKFTQVCKIPRLSRFLTCIVGNTIKNASHICCDKSRRWLGKTFLLTNKITSK
jgi:hypothetical protein